LAGVGALQGKLCHGVTLPLMNTDLVRHKGNSERKY